MSKHAARKVKDETYYARFRIIKKINDMALSASLSSQLYNFKIWPQISGVSVQRNARKKVRNKQNERKKSTQQT